MSCPPVRRVVTNREAARRFSVARGPARIIHVDDADAHDGVMQREFAIAQERRDQRGRFWSSLTASTCPLVLVLAKMARSWVRTVAIESPASIA